MLWLSSATFGQTCQNPNRKTYKENPQFCAPDGTRGVGISIRGGGGRPADVTDVRCKCLPIALRYNNPGVLKTPRGGWKGQSRDARGRRGQVTAAPTVGDGSRPTRGAAN